MKEYTINILHHIQSKGPFASESALGTASNLIMHAAQISRIQTSFSYIILARFSANKRDAF
jgi:hypothetical protein